MTDLSKKRALFLPMPGRLAVEPIEEERYGGLYLPTNRTEKATIGTIVALPPDYDALEKALRVEASLKLGDVVLFGANSGMTVEVGLGPNRRRAIFLRETEIISKVEWEEIEDKSPNVPFPAECPDCASISSYDAYEDICTSCGRLG